jgi:hypothetical protein
MKKDFHAIAVKKRFGIARWNEEIFARILGAVEKSKTFAVFVDRSNDAL